ncbi:unnamed protein product [Staurois parvus]|uniref:Uncharacterized protein n=1 Tax=Staurois parvus TaxID=386267 RepID=A0ABN9DJ56_9NEOB|nr:unnamed protein product [Staurois parvus]
MPIGSDSRVQDVPVHQSDVADQHRSMLQNALPPPSPATSDSALQASFLMHRHILDSTI